MDKYQYELALMARVEAPSVVLAHCFQGCETYRDAVRLCWSLRRVKGMTKRMLAAEAGLYHPHVSDYLSEDDNKRELPAKYIKAFEATCGNTAISQYLARQSKLTVLEELQARMAA